MGHRPTIFNQTPICLVFRQISKTASLRYIRHFLKEQGDELKAKIAPPIAVNYYRDGDLYMFDEIQISRPPREHPPIIKTNSEKSSYRWGSGEVGKWGLLLDGLFVASLNRNGIKP